MMIKKMQIGLFVMPKESTALKLFFSSDESEKNAFSVSLGHMKSITCESLITSCSKIASKFSFIPRGGGGGGGLGADSLSEVSAFNPPHLNPRLFRKTLKYDLLSAPACKLK